MLCAIKYNVSCIIFIGISYIVATGCKSVNNMNQRDIFSYNLHNVIQIFKIHYKLH